MLYLKFDKKNNLYTEYILSEATKILNAKLISIAHNPWKKQFNVSPNEYVSLSTYYWPDLNNPDGKYVKKTEINYDKYNLSDRKYIDPLLNNLQYLALAYKLTKNEDYAKKGIDFIKCFFLNSKTHMIPRLSHSGIILKSKDTFTTHGCIVDANSFWILGDLVELIFTDETKQNRYINQMKLWFKNISDWFLYSDYGLKAKDRTNNWLSSYYVQLLSYLYASGETELCKKVFENNFEKILTTQIDAYGNQLNEQCRDYPIHYCNYNLHLLTRLALIGQKYNISIWMYKNSKGEGNLYKAMLNTASMIKEKNTISEIIPNYNLTWNKIAYIIYGNDTFKDLSLQYENKLEYCLDEFLRLDQNF